MVLNFVSSSVLEGIQPFHYVLYGLLPAVRTAVGALFRSSICAKTGQTNIPSVFLLHFHILQYIINP